MDGFKVVEDINDSPSGKVTINSITVAIGDLLETTAGATTWVLTTSSTNHFTRKAIAMEAATTSDTTILVQELTGTEIVVANSTNNGATAQNGDRMALTDEDDVNNSGSDVTGQAAAFVQTGFVGAASDKTIKGKVLVGNGVDPDSA